MAHAREFQLPHKVQPARLTPVQSFPKRCIQRDPLLALSDTRRTWATPSAGVRWFSQEIARRGPRITSMGLLGF